MQQKAFEQGICFESNTVYYATKPEYHIYPDDSMEIVSTWYTFLKTDGKPQRAAFVMKDLENVTVDLGGAKLIFHGRILPFAAYRCRNVTFCNFSVDYDRPYYTQGDIVAVDGGSVTIRVSDGFGYRVEGKDLIVFGDMWEHRLTKGDMLIQPIEKDTQLPAMDCGLVLGLIGEKIEPRPNPPCPIYHLTAEDLGDRKVKISGFPEHFVPKVGQILAMTHEDRRKTGFLLEYCTDITLENIRLLHIAAFGMMASMCHNITARNYSMYLDDECKGRIVSINADSFHCFHCSGKILVENCRFESMLDDAINIHGNYTVCAEKLGKNRFTVDSLAAGRVEMPYYIPGDTINVYRLNTNERKKTYTVAGVHYLREPANRMVVETVEEIEDFASGDSVENAKMPEITVRNCRMKGTGGFRISSGKKVLIEDCVFENRTFAIAFTGDMNYWYESSPVEDVTIQNCRFVNCNRGSAAIVSVSEFQPTEKAPYYHRNVRILNNTFESFGNCAVYMKDTDEIVYKNNTFIHNDSHPAPKECERVTLIRCGKTDIE